MFLKDGSISTIRTNTTLLTFVLLAAIFAGITTMINLPQTIGLANAQSQQGSQHACPTGFTLSQGQCTAPVTLTCQPFSGGLFLRLTYS
jgi:hypothetical protein